MPTPDAYIFDAIRTPRGRGKANGSLHSVRPLDLLKTLFDEMKERHNLYPSANRLRPSKSFTATH